MAINPSAAAGAYASSQNITGQGSVVQNNTIKPLGDIGTPKTEQGDSFADLIQAGIESTIDSLEKSEEMSAKAITGEASVTDVVQAVTSAELSFQTLSTVRERMVNAYKEIMRMPV